MAHIERMVDRLVEDDEASRLFTMAHVIGSVPVPYDVLEATIVCPGLGEDIRVHAAIRNWEASPNNRHFIVAGTNDIEQTQPQLTLEALRQPRFGLTRTEGVITQVSAEHTKEQTEWLATQLAEEGVKSAALFVSNWHISRAYGTLVKSLLDRELDIPVFPVSVATDPFALVPETKQTVAAMSAGEARRITKYQELGHVTTLAEIQSYVSWLWRQDVAPIGNTPSHQ